MIPRYPNCSNRREWDSIPIFHQCEDTITKHIVKFREYLVTWDIMDEDLIMKGFVISLDLWNNKDMGD